MKVQTEIESILGEALAPQQLQVINESHMHNVPPNSETHFKVVVVSDQFDGKRSVARHQLVYSLLSEQMAGPVHALALHTFTAPEWQQSEQSAPQSPQCLGGSKADK